MFFNKNGYVLLTSACLCICVHFVGLRPCAIQEAMQELHEALAGGGGGATFIMDDGYCYGRSEEVLRAGAAVVAIGVGSPVARLGADGPCSGCVVVSPASVALAWRPLHARRTVLHDLDAALPGRLRRGRCACPPPPISRLELIGGSGPLAAPPAATCLPRAPSFRRPPSSRRGEALWERVEAGSGSLGAASSESTAGSGQVGSNWLGAVGCSAPALRLLSRPRFRPSR